MSPRPQPRHPHRPQPPAAPSPAVLVEIEKPIYGGAFLARHEGKAVFVPLTLPGEQTRVRVVESRKGWAAAEIYSIVEPAAERIAPRCPHFGLCGGCSYQHTSYEHQLQFKLAILRETLERAGLTAPAQIDTLSAEPWRYRNRVRFAFDAEGRWGYRGRRSHAVVPIDDCPLAAPVLTRAAQAFAELRATLSSQFRVAELALFATSDERSLLATVIATTIPAQSTFETLAEEWQQRVPELAGVELAVQAAADKFPRRLAVFEADSLHYTAAGQQYRVDHGAFFQVNRFLVDALAERVTGGREGHLAWDLFAGVGLFARQLASGFERVVAVEAAPSALPGLRANLPAGGEAVRAETLKFLESRPTAERPDLIVVDPPRTGLGPEICQHLVEIAAPQIVSVSCDPATLARDLKLLSAGGYAIERITLVDLFPQTYHLETVVDLRRA
jgi:23S rRNA (uracil1939-C5)-methyltransferase